MLNINAQKLLKIDDDFIGVSPNKGISSLDIDGRSKYTIPFNDWLEMNSENENSMGVAFQKTLTYIDFETKSDKLKKIVNEAKKDNVAISTIMLKQLLIHDFPFQFKIIEYDMHGDFKSLKLTCNISTEKKGKESAAKEFGLLVNLIKELYGDSTNSYSPKNERIYAWEGELTVLTLSADFNDFIINLIYSKKK